MKKTLYLVLTLLFAISIFTACIKKANESIYENCQTSRKNPPVTREFPKPPERPELSDYVNLPELSDYIQ